MKGPGLTGNDVDMLRRNIRSPGPSSTTVLGAWDFLLKKRRYTLSDLWSARPREQGDKKYLREATELIEAWQRQLQGVQSVSRTSSEHSKVVLTERQR